MNDKNTTTGMKKRIALIVLGTMLLMMGLAACGDKEPQTATLKLSANPTTGYEWSFTQTPTIFDIS
ncbi:MAG: protease inhibitor I42 family protein, partial [Clostridia bacterium]|nr:protease inhibitor I42 family protein [Clostridia bacterium]